MSRVAIVTDSTSDLPHDLAAQLGISVVPLTVTLDGTSYQDGVDIQAGEFYHRLSASHGAATTSQPPPGKFVELYETLLEGHDQVLSIHISGRLSGTVDSARQAADIVGGSRVVVVDSTGVSMALGLLVLAAAHACRQPVSIDEALEQLKPVQHGVSTYFTVATLEYLRRGGRIGSASALLGSVLQVKPLLAIAQGEVQPVEKVRTYERAVSRVIELARQSDRGHGICAIVGHAAREDAAQRICEALDPIADTLLVQPLGPVVGAHAGPGTVGVACYPAELLPLGIKRVLAATAG